MCGLYAEYPGAIIPNPAEAFLRGFWDTLCKDRPPGLPLPPAPPFNGGQCMCSSYLVKWRMVASNPAYSQEGSFGAYGEIGAMRFFRFPDGSAGTQIYCRGIYRGGCRELGWYSAGVNYAPVLEPFEAVVYVTSVVAIDGTPDNCGSLPAAYPPAVLPPDWHDYEYPHTYNDGTDFTVPIVIAPISGQAEVNFDIGEVNFNIDLGGVSFGDDALPPAPEYPGLPDDIADINRKIDDLQRDIDDANRKLDEDKQREEDKENPPDPEQDPQLTRGETEYLKGLTVPNLPNLKYVRIEMGDLPDKAQFGIASPTVYFGGWFEFLVGNYAYERQQITFASQQFTAPPGADGFAYTCTNGATARAVYYYSVEVLSEVKE